MSSGGRAPRLGALRSAARAARAAWTRLAAPPQISIRIGHEAASPIASHILDAQAEELLALGREQAFLDAVTAPGLRVNAGAIGMRLQALQAWSTAAAFVQRCPPSLPDIGRLRAEVRHRAREAAKALSLQAAPARYADAALALWRLEPDTPSRDEPVARAAAHMIALAAKAKRQGDVDTALSALIWSGRLRPRDGAILTGLAEAAGEAGDIWRREESLARLRDLQGGEAHRLAQATQALDAGCWGALAEILDRVGLDGVGRRPIGELISERRPWLGAQFSQFARAGDWTSGLGLVGALVGWIEPATWRPAELAGLLQIARRPVRDPRALADPATWSIPEFILRISPHDVDMGRLVGRGRLRQRRLRDAVRRLGHVLEIDPHGAGDWVDLGSAHERLGHAKERDACLARAVAIDPSALPAPVAEAFWARVEATRMATG